MANDNLKKEEFSTGKRYLAARQDFGAASSYCIDARRRYRQALKDLILFLEMKQLAQIVYPRGY